MRPTPCVKLEVNDKMKATVRVLMVVALAFLMLGAGQRHDFHVSILNIAHNSKSESLELTLKVFTDDLEAAVEKWLYEDLNLGTQDESPRADRYIQEYLTNRIKINLDGKPAEWKWLGKEVELDATWCYLEIQGLSTLKKIEISNHVLLEQFDDQSNLVHVEAAGKRQSLYLKDGDATGTLEF